MKRPQKAAIVGCGGIACALAPVLSREMDLVLIDADDYEPKNATRQFPALTSKGNKAEVLASMLQPNTLLKIQSIADFVQDVSISAHPEWKGVDIVFGCVDNNKSRRILAELSYDLEIPAILAGNEHEHGEAHLVIPQLYNPFNHFEFPENEPVPWGCNTDKVLDEFPQTALANTLASGCALHILMSWLKVQDPLNAIAHSRHDALSSTCSRVKNILAQPSQAVA